MNPLRLFAGILCVIWFQSCDSGRQETEYSPESILLKDFKPVSLFRIPITTIQKARYPVIDMHTHGDYVKTQSEVDHWVEVMDETVIEKVIVLTQAHGAEFDTLVDLYSSYPDRFELWCGFDYTGYNKPEIGRAHV